MQFLVYYLSLPLIYLVSLLPFWCLYLLSDFLHFILFQLIGYRREVVYTNLKNSFPKKSDKEILQIQGKFNRYFCDLTLESLKSLTISPKTLRKRVQFSDNGIFEQYKEQDKSVIIAMGHFGNWELGGARFALEPVHKLYVIYHPLKNKYFDGLVYKMRTRLGNGLYSMKDSLRMILADRNNLTATAFIADQTPLKKGAHWMTFMNQDTPVFMGMGKIATKLNDPVVYISISRLKRGYYEMKAEKLIENPSEFSPEEVVEAFTRRLEEDIHRIPEIWLWSHRRWKHKRETK